MSSVKKVVLAYSGGLDTSIIIPWIKENYGGAEIVAYCGDVGQGDDLEAVRRKALATGASKCVVEDLREEFVRDYAYAALAAGAVYEDNYLLGTALARPLLAYRQVLTALKEGADALAHGATGKGNDQVRFEVTYATFAPHLKVIAPWREWNIRSREDALAYAATHGVPVDQSPRDMFSRDGNLWHLSHEGGNLEDPWDAPRKEMFKLTVDPEDAPDEPQVVTLGLERGVPVMLDGERLGPVEMVETLNRIAGSHGVGRLDLVENRLVGIKSRGVYETPAGTVLHVAHREIERLVLDRNTLHFKQSVSVRYAQLIYDGLWFSTLRQALAAFVAYTEKEVTGEVKVRLFKGRAEAIGRRSPRSLYRQDLATFGEGMAYDHQDAEGFIRLFGLPERVRALTRDAEGVEAARKGTAEKARKPAEKVGTRR
jgi:argininosuccinate synthase